MRVLVIVDPQISVPPSHYGGTERIVALLCQELTKAGHEVRLLAGRGSRDYGGGLIVHHAPSKARVSRVFHKLYFQWLSWRALEGIDVVINNGRLDYLPVIALRAPSLVTWFHNPVRQGEIDYFNVIRRSRRCEVFISESQAATLRSLGERCIIHNAVDTDFFTFSPSPSEPAYAVFLGRLTKNKGVHLAIDVARRAGIHLKIAGNVSTREERGLEYFEQTVRPELGRDCEWVGEVDDMQKRELLHGACALLFPIKWAEPFGIVMAESLACGTPVVALRRASVPEVIRHGVNGFICENVDEMVTALRDIRSLSRARCREDAVERFGAKIFFERSMFAIEQSRSKNRPKKGGGANYVKAAGGQKANRTILIIADPQHPVPPILYGGAERIAALLCDGLQQSGWVVRLMAGPGSQGFGGQLWIHRAPSRRLYSRAFRKLLFQRRSIEAARGCDAIVNFGRVDYLLALLRTKIPIVCRFGNPVLQTEIDFINHRRGENKSFVFISKDQCEELVEATPQRIIYNAVDVDMFSPTGRSIADRDYFLFVGRLTRNKGVHLAIEAAERTGSKLMIAGNIADEPGNQEFFEAEVKPRLGQRCSWLGPVDDFQKRTLMRNAKALLFPIQWREPFGIVMAESLACGTPVIAMRNGSVPEVVNHGKTGYICDSMHDLCDAILKVTDLTSDQCRSEAVERFGPKRYLSEMTAAISDAGAQSAI